jgi:hypothetical protein
VNQAARLARVRNAHSKCCGRPEHNYADGIITGKQRILPGDLSVKIKKAPTRCRATSWVTL